jgi:hypothetical protein
MYLHDSKEGERVKTAAQALANWQASAGAAATNYQAGINGYNGDWAGATVGAYNNWVAGLANAQANGNWQRGVQNAGTSGWKSASVAKVGNYSTGFSAGAGEYGNAIGKVMGALQNIVPSLPPRGTYDQNKLRATTLMDSLHALKGQLSASG